MFFAALIVVAMLIIKNKWQFEKTYLFVNTVLLLFVVFDLGTVIWDSVNKKTTAKQVFDWSGDSTKPDIYYFIFDSYTASRFLQEKFGYDNSAIDTALIKKGFRIIPNSHSNYNLTPFSLGSTFHLDYLADTDTTQEYYLKYYLWYLLITSLTWYSVYHYSYLISTVFVLYSYQVIYKYQERVKVLKRRFKYSALSELKPAKEISANNSVYHYTKPKPC